MGNKDNWIEIGGMCDKHWRTLDRDLDGNTYCIRCDEKNKREYLKSKIKRFINWFV